MTALDAGDEDDDGDDDGGDDGGRGRDDDPVQLLGALAPHALGPDLAALLVGHVAGGDLQLLQGHHAHHDAFLPEGKLRVKLSQMESRHKSFVLRILLVSRFMTH